MIRAASNKKKGSSELFCLLSQHNHNWFNFVLLYIWSSKANAVVALCLSCLWTTALKKEDETTLVWLKTVELQSAVWMCHTFSRDRTMTWTGLCFLVLVMSLSNGSGQLQLLLKELNYVWFLTKGQIWTVSSKSKEQPCQQRSIMFGSSGSK